MTLKTKRFFAVLTCTAVFAVLLGGEATVLGAEEKKLNDSARTTVQMVGFAYHFGGLLPLAVSEAEYSNKDNRSKITQHLTALKDGSHDVKATMPIPEDDPALKYVARGFDQHFQRTLELYEGGFYDKSRRLLLQTTRYCISCHTRHGEGPNAVNDNSAALVAKYPPLQKADYFAAIRNFPEALKLYEQGLTEKGFAERAPKQWENVAKRMLAITVRVKQDPFLTMELISRLRDEKGVPAGLLSDSLHWRSAAKAWSEEGSKPKETDVAKLERIRELWRTAASFLARGSDGGLIQTLRASGMAHDLLREAAGKPYWQELLWLSANIAENLADLNLWTMHETYLEACVRSDPSTKVAATCLAKLKAVKKTELEGDFWTPRQKAVIQGWLSGLEQLDKP